MKPETLIALVRMTERAKQVQSEWYPRRWIRLGYVGATLTSIFGTFLMTAALDVIAKNGRLLGGLYLLVTLTLTIAPWYFLVRFNFNRTVQLLCDAILSINQSGKDSAT